MPDLYLFGGPNGAGKTTTALKLLPNLGCEHFVNADLLARGLAPLGGNVDFQAGALMMRQLRKFRDASASFGTESTLAARTLLPLIRECQQRGYRFHLFYLWLPSAEAAVARVAARVRAGGHDIPPEVVHRRYEAGRQNFRDLYRATADTWVVHDNSSTPKIVARGGQSPEEIIEAGTWRQIIR